MASQLTPYLLEPSLLNYTIAVTGDALRVSDPTLEVQTKKRAAYALKFFLDILDPLIEEEKIQRDIFHTYHAALTGTSVFCSLCPPELTIFIDLALAKSVLQDLPNVNTDSTKKSPQSANANFFELSPTQKVLSLQDTLDLIFSHLPLLTKSDRETARNASLTSHAFHNVTQLRLWRRPRDLDTVEQQVRFAFGAAISGAVSESLGNYVKRLRIRIAKGTWNMRIIQQIAFLTPTLEDLTLHWGDSEDGPEEVTNTFIEALNKILSSFPLLKHLNLAKFSYTPEIDGELAIPTEAEIPFANLESIQLYDFHWYWKPIATGLGVKLSSLDIGFGTAIDTEEIVKLSTKVPSLTSLTLGLTLTLTQAHSIVANIPRLEHVEFNTFSNPEDTYVAGIVPLLVSLGNLKTISLSTPISTAQLESLAMSSCPLEHVYLTLEESEDMGIKSRIIKLLKSKKNTLKSIFISFSGQFNIKPSDDIVDALASIPQIERIGINFDSTHNLSVTSVNSLLKNCPHLVLTDDLESLVAGNILYEAEYKVKFERMQEEKEKESEEDVLGN